MQSMQLSIDGVCLVVCHVIMFAILPVFKYSNSKQTKSVDK